MAARINGHTLKAQKQYAKSERAGRRGNLERALKLEKKADRNAVKGRR